MNDKPISDYESYVGNEAVFAWQVSEVERPGELANRYGTGNAKPDGVSTAGPYVRQATFEGIGEVWCAGWKRHGPAIPYQPPVELTEAERRAKARYRTKRHAGSVGTHQQVIGERN